MKSIQILHHSGRFDLERRADLLNSSPAEEEFGDFCRAPAGQSSDLKQTRRGVSVGGVTSVGAMLADLLQNLLAVICELYLANAMDRQELGFRLWSS